MIDNLPIQKKNKDKKKKQCRNSFGEGRNQQFIFSMHSMEMRLNHIHTVILTGFFST